MGLGRNDLVEQIEELKHQTRAEVSPFDSLGDDDDEDDCFSECFVTCCI